MKKIWSVALSFTIASSALANDASFNNYIEGLKKEARSNGISERTIQEAFAGVSHRPKAVTADKNQPEKRLTLDEYIPRAVPDWKVKQAKALYEKHYQELQSIGLAYGVQPRFIVALWGVESNFGKFTGNYKVIDALSTLAFDGRREAFFRKETMAALEILDQGHIKVEDFKDLGTWKEIGKILSDQSSND